MQTNVMIKQISVFLENRTGRTGEVTRALAGKNINVLAFSLAESGDFGLLRLIVDNVPTAVETLKSAGFATILTDVVRINCPNRTGSLAQILDRLAAADISFDYMYAFQYDGLSAAVVRPDNLDRCVKALENFD